MGKAITFLIVMWICISIAGSITTGSVAATSTTITANITSTEVDSIPVASTVGFPDSGFIVIEGEVIGYPHKSATAFEDTFLEDIARGQSSGLIASAHLSGAKVRTVEGGMINDSLQYQVSTFTDSSGVLGLISIPIKFLRLIVSFAIVPLDFLGTDLQILTFLWMAIVIGIITAIGISVAGGRRI